MNREISLRLQELNDQSRRPKKYSTIDHRTVTKWIEKFHLGCKNDQSRRPKNVDSDWEHIQDGEANPALVSLTPLGLL